MSAIGIVRPDRQTLASQIARELSRMILGGNFASGERLPSYKELAGSFGVSTATIREAIASLARNGVLEARAGSGTYVRDGDVEPETMAFWFGLPRTEEEIVELVEARCIIDAGLARMAATRRSDADVAALRAIVVQMQRSVGNLEAFVDGEVAFHMTVARAARNKPLLRSMQAMLTVLRDSISYSLQQEDGRMQWVVDTKTELVDAIEARQADRASTIVDLLMNRVRRGATGMPPASGAATIGESVSPSEVASPSGEEVRAQQD